jgi:transmembrane sensor
MLNKPNTEKDTKMADEFEKLSNYMGSLELPEGRTKDDAWKILINKIESTEQTIATVRHFPLKTVLSIAASVIIIFGSWLAFRYFSLYSVSASNGQTADIVLPDNSRLKLNSGTTIKYNKYRWKNNRHVLINGEAFFDVVKGNEFIVESEGKKITVLGTTFNVYSRDQKFEVRCFSGKVRVEIPSVKPALLVKGQAVKSDASHSTFNTFSFNPEQDVRWTKGEFYFEQEKLDFVFEEMERQFNVTIVSPAFNERLYTGFFRKGSLKMALDNVCLPMGIEYEIADSAHIVIK